MLRHRLLRLSKLRRERPLHSPVSIFTIAAFGPAELGLSTCVGQPEEQAEDRSAEAWRVLFPPSCGCCLKKSASGLMTETRPSDSCRSRQDGRFDHPAPLDRPHISLSLLLLSFPLDWVRKHDAPYPPQHERSRTFGHTVARLVYSQPC